MHISSSGAHHNYILATISSLHAHQFQILPYRAFLFYGYFTHSSYCSHCGIFLTCLQLRVEARLGSPCHTPFHFCHLRLSLLIFLQQSFVLELASFSLRASTPSAHVSYILWATSAPYVLVKLFHHYNKFPHSHYLLSRIIFSHHHPSLLTTSNLLPLGQY